MADAIRVIERGAETLVDPSISRAKYGRELAAYREVAEDRRRQGWWLLDAEFPNVLVAFTLPQLRPQAVAFGALLNFDNYDLWPPSVKIVNPFTGVPLKMRDIPASLHMRRKIKGGQIEIPVLGLVQQETEQPLLLAHAPDDIPFLCIPGTREYHDHPAHTGDSWLLHRSTGEGTLTFILDVLWKYGAAPIKGYHLGIQITDFARPESPE